jgi:hypothetical protein
MANTTGIDLSTNAHMTRIRNRGACATGRAPRAAGVALVAASLLAACTASPAEPSGRTSHTEEEGPLSASIGVGGNSLMAPDATTWTGTFGGFVLCSQEPETNIELQRIRHRSSVTPVKVVPTIRTTEPDSLRPLKPGQRQEFLPTYAALGSPPEFAEPYVEVQVPGEYSTAVLGRRVEETCEETAALEHQLSAGKVPSRPLNELMFAVTAGARGAKIEQVSIDYLADGRPMTLQLHWTMVSCGSATTGPGLCRP